MTLLDRFRTQQPQKHPDATVRLAYLEELPLTESVNLSVGVFGKSFLTGEPQRLMQGFLDRKK